MRFKEIMGGTPREKEASRTVKRLKAKSSLKEQDKAKLTEAQKTSRRLFLRRSALLGGALLTPGVGALLSNALSTPESEEKRPSWITIRGEKEMGTDRVREAIRAAKDWDAVYKVGRNITIMPLEVEDVQKMPDGSTLTTVELADTGIIKLGESADPYNTVLHAMSHTIRSDTPTILDIPIRYKDITIKGYRGLSLLTVNSAGEEIEYNRIEEGMAERNAFIFKGYTSDNPRYAAAGIVTRNKLPFDKYPKAHDWVRTNNFPDFVRTILNLSPETEISKSHIELVVGLYDLAWDRAR